MNQEDQKFEMHDTIFEKFVLSANEKVNSFYEGFWLNFEKTTVIDY